MDSQALQKAILDCTLSDKDAVADLLWRAEKHAKADRNSPLYRPIADLIKGALNATATARDAKEPIVPILKKMLLDLGHLKLERALEQGENIDNIIEKYSKTREEPSPNLPPKSLKLKATFARDLWNSVHPSSNPILKDTAKVEHELSSKKGKHLMTSQKGKRDIVPPSQLRAHSRSVSPSGGFGSLAQPSKQYWPVVRKPAPPASSFAPASTTSSRFASVSLEEPAAKREAATVTQYRKSARRPRKKPVSKAIISDSDASDELSSPEEYDRQYTTTGYLTPNSALGGFNEEGEFRTAATGMPTKVSNSAIKRTRDLAAEKAPEGLDYVDLSDGLSGFKYRDDNGSPAKRPHGRQAMINGIIRPALIVKLKFSTDRFQAQMRALGLWSKKRKGDEQLETKPAKKTAVANKRQGRRGTSATDPQNAFQQAIDRSKSLLAPPSTSSTRSLNSTPDTQAADTFLARNVGNASHLSPTLPSSPYLPTYDNTHNVNTSTNTSAPSLLLPSNLTLTQPAPTSTSTSPSHSPFPPFPVLNARSLPLWIKGLIIAVENILADHKSHPTASIAEILSQLEDEAPTIPGDDRDRLIVMNGSQYVYDAVRGMLGEKKDRIASGLGGEAGDGNDDVYMDMHTDTLETEGKRKVYYKGKGRAWKKTEEDNDPDFPAKGRVPSVPERKMERRTASRAVPAVDEAWRKTEEMFGEFCRHVRGEYHRCARELGVVVEKEGMPKWLME